MLRLESIQLHGFKSFADRTCLEFPQGITCIVGPNGCGKSNIADAVAWVLGEQSAKSLRGDRMDDVIFAGSNGRKPKPYAEVTMNWVRLEALENEDENRLVISRRLAKNGFSEYTMNQAPCRLKDIQSALMDFGMGTRAYTIVQQGKIGYILNAKPLERRALIEEAAGILKYKVRRDESEVKLKTAEDNLLRINDIIREVQKRRGQLNRQVGKARRYKKLKEKMREVEKTLLTTEIYHQSKTLREVIVAFEKTRRREMTVNTDISQRDAQVTSLRKEQIVQEKRLRQLENKLNTATQEISLAEEHSKFKQERIVERETQLDQLDRDRVTGQKEQRDLLNKLAQREKDLRKIGSRLEKAGSMVEDAEREETLLAQTAQKELDELEKRRRAHEKDNADRLSLNVEKQQIDSQRKQIDFQKASTEQRIYALTKESEELVQKRENTKRALAKSEGDLTQATSQIADIQETWAAQKVQLDQAERSTQEANRELQRLEDKIRSLNEIMEARLGVGDATKTLLERSEERTSHPLTLLRDVLDSNHAFDEALDWILEPYGDAILITSDEDKRQFDQLGSDLGIQSIDLRHELPAADASGTFLKPSLDVAAALDQVIAEPRLKTALKPVLGHVFIVKDGSDIAQLGPLHPDLCLVSAKGDLMVRGAWAANRGSERGQGGFLTLKGDIERADQSRKTAEQHCQRIQKDLQAAQMRLKETDDHLQDKRNQSTQLEKDILVGQQQLETLKSLQRAHQANLELEQSRSKDLESQISQWTQRQAELADRISVLETNLTKSEAALKKQEKVVAQAQKKIRDISLNLVKLREKHANDQTLAARIQAEREHLSSLSEAYAKRREQGEEKKLRLEAEVRQLKADITQLQAKIEKTFVERDTTQSDLQKQETAIEKIREKAEQLDAEIKELHGRRDDLRAEEGRYELENARISSKIAHLQEKYQANCGSTCVVDDVDPSTLPEADILEEMEEERTQMRDRLDRMGAVNLLAIEEFDEVDERYQFLINQQKDLLDSITEIRSTIHKLNKISSEKFIAAFLEINKRFSECFQQLFGGGRAQMLLVDEENILESGLDLLVKPPGKKLQNVSLMSGGEKALTAIALMLAIFEYRPSPFCLFDEVDAPLDEANIMRFLRKLEDLKTQTQFILITHQKSTMAAASSLFGVTMEKGGCSKLVSVAFD